MQTETISLEETGCFSKTFLDYLSGSEGLLPFYRFKPEIESFKSAIESRPFPKERREKLVKVLSKQYEISNASPTVSKNIEALRKAGTFTITTGHQLNIFTGPLYFLYKIITVINTCKALSQTYPEYDFVPVYWMASEDHDFEEINHFLFEGKKITWETNQKGAVGRFDPEELRRIAEKLPQGAFFFREAYNMSSLSDAVRNYVNFLFGNEGLIVIDADAPDLKRTLIPVIEDDLFSHTPEVLASKTTAMLNSLGHKTQVNARQINFFYLKGDVRERIEKKGNEFEVLNTDIRFSEEEIKGLIRNQPEEFSPNVILRPLYQEMILPNLAYVGGPSELIYWLQLKDIFNYFDMPFPILMPRNFSLVCPLAHKRKWDKIGFSKKDLFLDTDRLFTKWVSQNSLNDISYEEELSRLQKVELTSKSKANQVDPSLSQHLEAIYASFSKKLKNAEKKTIRAAKRKFGEKKLQIDAIKNSLFPDGTLQERKENFLKFYLKDPQFIQHLMETFDPFNYQMYILYE
ncbi:MAG: bacillithiol biosynthesis cysteine-adding enzyme BshC [Ekhidna sp.]|nr:bacillithiol biosynthesis cysteine-adding enzyme BshC [Ekhidna sp.]